jgi:type IV secretory pathway TraG/TraD family ATPase VirD4
MIQVFSFAPQKLDRWILAHCSEQILTQYKSQCAVPPKTMQCTISTALTTLHIYTTDKVQRITNETNFSLATLRSEGGVLYLTGSPSSAYHYRAVYAILIQSFFNEILHTDVANDDHDLMFLLDEIGNVTIPGLPSFLSLCRKRRCSVATLWQDTTGQIVRNYGKDGSTTILANSAVKAFLPGPKSVEVCAMLERLCGKFNFEEDGHVKTRDLLTAQEAYQTKDIILLDNNEPPLLIKPYPFYEDRTLLKRSQIAPYYPDTEDTFSDTVLIDFS